MEDSLPYAEAVAIEGDRIIFVGDKNKAMQFKDTHTRLINRPNKMVLPGFIDSHVHLLWGGIEMKECQLSGLESKEEIVSKIKTYIERNPQLNWIRGNGWSLPVFEDGNPSKYLLDEINKDKYTKHILRYLANDNIDKGSEVLAAKLATDISRFDFAIQVSKIASYQKRFHNKYNYPIISTPTKVGGRKIPESALILSIIRQESEFDTSANSRVGAQGLMQLMPYTAKTVAKQAKLSYSKSRLTKSPEYNINLGSFYIAGLILEYDGSYPFSMAAYNAGPKRVKYWKRLNKNPQKKQTDYIDWIELIPFKETRNYVQRVLENYNVYRYVLSQKPIYLKDFFKNNPLY